MAFGDETKKKDTTPALKMPLACETKGGSFSPKQTENRTK